MRLNANDTHYHLVDLNQLPMMGKLLSCIKMKPYLKGSTDVADFRQKTVTGNWVGSFLILLLQVFLAASTYAGPPLAIDDPGILEPGAWEVILAYSVEDRPSVKITHAPSLDVSVGVGANSQLSFFLPRTQLDIEQKEKESGFGLASIGYKWQFASTPEWAWAAGLNYGFLISHDLYPVRGPDDIEILSLPLLVSHTHGNWSWFGQVTWHRESGGLQFWDYGVAVSHPVGSRVQVMAEVFGYTVSSFNAGELNYNLGLDIEVTPSIHILTSAGSRINSRLEKRNRLDYSFYAGLQWFPGN